MRYYQQGEEIITQVRAQCYVVRDDVCSVPHILMWHCDVSTQAITEACQKSLHLAATQRHVVDDDTPHEYDHKINRPFRKPILGHSFFYLAKQA